MFSFACELDCSLTIKNLNQQFCNQLKLQCIISYPKEEVETVKQSLTFDIEFKLVNICVTEIETNRFALHSKS